MINRFGIIRCGSLLVLLLATSANAGVIRYEFRQDGFDEGAFLIGEFFGEDTSGDGQLGYFPGGPPGFDEITDFNAEFSGNSLVPSFVAGFGDLFGLVYDLNLGPVIGDGTTGAVEGIGVTLVAPGLTYTTGSGPGPFPGGVISSAASATTTQNNAVVTGRTPSVPEPGSLAVWGVLAAAGFGFGRRRRV